MVWGIKYGVLELQMWVAQMATGLGPLRALPTGLSTHLPPLSCCFTLVNGSYGHSSEKSLLDLDLAEGPSPSCHQGLFLPAGTPPPRGHPPVCERLLHFPHPNRYVPISVHHT